MLAFTFVGCESEERLCACVVPGCIERQPAVVDSEIQRLAGGAGGQKAYFFYVSWQPCEPPQLEACVGQ